MLFNEEQQNVLKATLNRLIPADDYPGAWDAGVGDYIEKQLAGELNHQLDRYKAGLDSIDREAMHRFGMKFSSLTADKQDELLKCLEAGKVETIWSVPPSGFFSMMVSHAAEGYYADPGQGGNQDEISWKMIGF